MTAIGSRDNPRVRRWRDLAEDARARRKERRVLIEGEHLVAAFLDSGGKVEALIVRESETGQFESIAKRAGGKAVVVTDSVFKSLADTGTPAGIAAEIAIPEVAAELDKAASCVFLDSIQDAGNVGAILRSAAAFGIPHAVLGKGCADAWSPKVLRAGMGAHFTMAIEEHADLAHAIARFDGKVACTVVRGGTALKDADLSGRLGWIFGSEGRGVSAAITRLAKLKVMIPMPGESESLNVAAAAAICFYEATRGIQRRMD
jgi:TrmH family RNA methyltransferase